MRAFLTALCLLFVVSATAQKNTQKQINNLRNQREQLQKKINKSEDQLKKTQLNVKKNLTTLAQLGGQIEAHERSIKNINIQIDSITHVINRLNKEYNELNAQLTDKKIKYRQSMRYLYKNRKAENKLLFVLSAENFSQMARRYRYMREYATYQRVQGMLIQKKQAQVDSVRHIMRKNQAEKQQMLTNVASENDKLKTSKEKQERVVKDLQKKQKEIQNVLAASKKEMAALNSKIEYYVQLAIEQERKRREEEERKRREAEARERAKADAKSLNINKASRGSGGGKSKSGGSSSASAGGKSAPMQAYSGSKSVKLSSDFASNQGRLPVPISGPYVISAHFGSYTMPGMKNVRLDNKGVNYTSKSPANARCIFNGEVSNIFSFGGYKNILVRHGAYISVYCNLSSVSVSTGQKVSTGQSLGAIGKDASGSYTLHFQLRKETTLLNPERWVSR